MVWRLQAQIPPPPKQALQTGTKKDGPRLTQSNSCLHEVLWFFLVTPGSNSRVLSMRSKDPVIHLWSPAHSRITPGFASTLKLHRVISSNQRTRDQCSLICDNLMYRGKDITAISLSSCWTIYINFYLQTQITDTSSIQSFCFLCSHDSLFRLSGVRDWHGRAGGGGLSEVQRKRLPCTSVLSGCSSEFPADEVNEITGVCIFTSLCGRSKREGIYVHIQLIHFILQQKLMQRCKVAILQLKNDKSIHIYLFTKINKNKAFKLYINYNLEITMQYVYEIWHVLKKEQQRS